MGTCAKKYAVGIVLGAVLIGGHVCASLAQLAEPKDGRSMRTTSTRRDAKGEENNYDNQRVKPGETVVLLD